MRATLKKVFGFQEFRPNQEEIIRQILAGRDVFAVMPTGGGKSLCYQLPARMMEGTVVVISPLISLMKDQVDSARENGIEAAFINSALSPPEMAEVLRKVRQNALELLYIAPERFAMPGFIETLQAISVSLFAIDEAHCISEWGHDFRPDYLSLSSITRTFSRIPVAAFTATATPRVQDDIIARLGLRSPYVVRASFNRPNLLYRVERKSRLKSQVLGFLARHREEPGIIYRTTRDSVEELARFLSNHGIRALPYHAGLEPEVRKHNQDAFNRDEATVVVATIAFGMGIDKSNVRFVIHGDLPKNMESYYQETGRAGRDGEPAHCVLFFGRGDIPKIRYFIDRILDERERAVAVEKLNQIVRYASLNVCRRRQILEYFGEDYGEENCGACDICTGTVERVDVTIDAQKVLSAVYRTGQRFGVTHVVDIVSGADTRRIRKLGHQEIRTYGVGRDKDKKYWRHLADELLAQGILRREGDRYPVLKITPKGRGVLFHGDRVIALRREETRPKSRVGGQREGGLEPYDELLFQELRGLRKRLADLQQVPPFVVFSDRTLHEMCRRYPATRAEMRGIVGVGEVKIERYGEDFARAVRTYLDAHPEVGRSKEIPAPPLDDPGARKGGATIPDRPER